MMTAPFRPLLGLLALLVLSACSGTGTDDERTQREPPDRPEAEPVEIVHADYETFDPAPYRESPPERQAELRHDVPERLMEGRAAEGITETIQGWRIQVLSTADREEANRTVERAMAWWRARQEYERGRALGESVIPLPEPAPVLEGVPEDTTQAATEEVEEEPPVHLTYSQPYYRVRVGDFANREEAAALSEALRRRFPGAFVVPDVVTITR